jgi:HEAT repeat protein
MIPATDLRTSVETLIALLGMDRSPGVRSSAAYALGLLGDRRALPALTSALRDHNDLVRTTAATALGPVGDSRTVGLLLPLLESPSQYERAGAQDGLAQLSIRGRLA